MKPGQGAFGPGIGVVVVVVTPDTHFGMVCVHLASASAAEVLDTATTARLVRTSVIIAAVLPDASSLHTMPWSLAAPTSLKGELK